MATSPRATARSVPWRPSRTSRTTRWRVADHRPGRRGPATTHAGDIAKFDIQPTAVAGKFDPHTPEFQFWQAKLALIAGLRTWRQIDGRFLRRWFGDQNQLPVLTDAGDDLNAFYDRDEPAVLLPHVRRRDGQLGGERGRRDPRRGSCLPRRHPTGLLRCPVHRSRCAPRGVRRLHGDRHRARGPRSSGTPSWRRPRTSRPTTSWKAWPRRSATRSRGSSERATSMSGRCAMPSTRSNGPTRPRCRRMHPPTSSPARSTASPGCSAAPSTTSSGTSTSGAVGRVRWRCGRPRGRRASCWWQPSGSCPPRRARSAASASGCSRSTCR